MWFAAMEPPPAWLRSGRALRISIGGSRDETRHRQALAPVTTRNVRARGHPAPTGHLTALSTPFRPSRIGHRWRVGSPCCERWMVVAMLGHICIRSTRAGSLDAALFGKWRSRADSSLILAIDASKVDPYGGVDHATFERCNREGGVVGNRTHRCNRHTTSPHGTDAPAPTTRKTIPSKAQRSRTFAA
jgi:hypothetical protein